MQDADDETDEDRDASRARDPSGVLAPPAGFIRQVEAQTESGGQRREQQREDEGNEKDEKEWHNVLRAAWCVNV